MVLKETEWKCLVATQNTSQTDEKKSKLQKMLGEKKYIT